MNYSTMTPAALAKITGTDRHYFRIVSAEVIHCQCCKKPLQAAYESFSTPDGDDMDRNAIAGFCVPCVLKGGQNCIMEGIREMVKEFNGTDTEPWETELWLAVLEQFERGLFEIQIPQSAYELAETITGATAKFSENRDRAFVGLIEGVGSKLGVEAA
jgi:hypothetical protein